MITALLIGLLFGFILQRGQFCFVSGFRQLLWQKDLRFLATLLLAISIQSIGLFSLAHYQLITIPQSPMPITATLLGGALFGTGMAFGNCCGSGSWFRTGEGAMGSLLALVSFALTMASCQTGVLKGWIAPLTAQTSSLDTLHQTFALSPWYLVALLIIITAGILIIYQPRSSNLLHRWGVYATGVSLGLLGVLAWYFSEQAGRNFGFGIAVPTGNVVQYLVMGQHRFLNWGTLFVLAIPLGSLLSSKLNGTFQWKIPEANKAWQRILGGFLMGVGAALAGGCTITNTLVATAYFSWQGYVATLAILASFAFTHRFLLHRL